MTNDREEVEATFDARAARYATSDWHVRYAERLVQLAQPTTGERVLDAACGTGFATLPAARAVGPSGHVVGVDISAGMLSEAERMIIDNELTNVDLVRNDVTDLAEIDDRSFDLVVCAAGLLYLPIEKALAEWARLLRVGGRLAFSSMHEGYPVAARVFRDLAATFGVSLDPPHAPLGTPDRCRRVLERAGFSAERIVVESIRFSRDDLAEAWDVHVRSPHFEAVRELPSEELEEMRRQYASTLDALLASDPSPIAEARVIYAMGEFDFRCS